LAWGGSCVVFGVWFCVSKMGPGGLYICPPKLQFWTPVDVGGLLRQNSWAFWHLFLNIFGVWKRCFFHPCGFQNLERQLEHVTKNKGGGGKNSWGINWHIFYVFMISRFARNHSTKYDPKFNKNNPTPKWGPPHPIFFTPQFKPPPIIIDGVTKWGYRHMVSMRD